MHCFNGGKEGKNKKCFQIVEKHLTIAVLYPYNKSDYMTDGSGVNHMEV